MIVTSDENISSFFDKVLKFLSFRPRSEFEINEYMLRKGWDEETRKKIMEKLKNLQLIDDEAFARQWLASRTHFRPEGKSLVKKELRKKGIKREIIDQLLQDERGSATEEILAEKYARKKMERLKSLPVLVAKRRLFSALLMRGFDNEIAKTVVDKLLERE